MTETTTARKQSQERAALLAIHISRVSKEYPHVIARHVVDLQGLAHQALTAAVNLCNLRDYQDKHDRKVARLKKKAAEILADFGPGFAVSIGGDPRGASCLYLKIDGQKGDGWDAERGFAVY